MGIEKVVTIVCDFPKCKGNNKSGPTVLSWNETKVQNGEIAAPEAAQYLVFSSHNGTAKNFCCQLCAASYFLPNGWSIVKNPVIPFPSAEGGWVDQGDGTNRGLNDNI